MGCNSSLLINTNSHKPMHKSTLDLFCNDDNQEDTINDIFDDALEEQAAKYEVTVDYYIAEFLV